MSDSVIEVVVWVMASCGVAYGLGRALIRWRRLQPSIREAHNQQVFFREPIRAKPWRTSGFGWSPVPSGGMNIAVGDRYVEVYGPAFSRPLGGYTLFRTDSASMTLSNEPNRMSSDEWIVISDGEKRLAVRSKSSDAILWNQLARAGLRSA